MHFTDRDASLEGTFTAPETTSYYFTCSGLGPSKLVIDDKVIYEQKGSCEDAMGFLFGGSNAPEVKVSFEAGKQYKFFIYTSPPASDGEDDLGILEGHIGLRVGCLNEAEHDRDLVAEAVELAKKSDYAVIFTGHETTWETEGQDQLSFNLPKDGSQDRLVAAVAAVNPKTIVVNSTGVAVAMPWLDQVQGLVQSWYGGQECGNSIADVLTGARNPEGHLSCTFPKKLEDCPAYGNFPGKYIDGKLHVEYEEGVFVGYRHFDRLSTEKVNFPFGYGLSYTSFDFSDLEVKESGDDFVASVKVGNAGGVEGGIAVQLYVGNAETSAENPIKQLAAFRKVTVKPGETQTVELPVRSRDFAHFDVSAQKWVVKGGVYNFMIGRSAADVVLASKKEVKEKAYDP